MKGLPFLVPQLSPFAQRKLVLRDAQYLSQSHTLSPWWHRVKKCVTCGLQNTFSYCWDRNYLEPQLFLSLIKARYKFLRVDWILTHFSYQYSTVITDCSGVEWTLSGVNHTIAKTPIRKDVFGQASLTEMNISSACVWPSILAPQACLWILTQQFWLPHYASGYDLC